MERIGYLDDVSDWKRLVEERPANQQLVIFKTSQICPVSHWAERTLKRWLADLPDDVPVAAYSVDVVRSRGLSDQLARDLDVPHQSPQVIWLDEDLLVRWHASHSAITKHALDQQLSAGFP